MGLDIVRYGEVWWGVVRYGFPLPKGEGERRENKIRFMVRYGLVGSGSVRSGKVGFGTV